MPPSSPRPRRPHCPDPVRAGPREPRTGPCWSPKLNVCRLPRPAVKRGPGAGGRGQERGDYIGGVRREEPSPLDPSICGSLCPCRRRRAASVRGTQLAPGPRSASERPRHPDAPAPGPGPARQQQGVRRSLVPAGPGRVGRWAPRARLTRRPRPQTENRRITHISAEQKRRFNIKLGFDTLHGLVTTLSAQPSLKVSTPLLPATEQGRMVGGLRARL